MASPSGPPPGLSRPKTPKDALQSSQSFFTSSSFLLPITSPTPRRPHSASWASSLAAGLFPPTFGIPFPPQIPQGIQPAGEAVHPAGCLPQPPTPLLNNNTLVTNLAVFPAPLPSDLWHVAHVRVCAHASVACAACSVAFVCCSCRALRFTPSIPPVVSSPPSVQPGPLHCSRSASPALFRLDVGNGSPPPGFDAHCDIYDDEAYVQALVDSDTCDNSSCPRGAAEPATYTITVEQFDEGSEEAYDHTFRACSACNRSCKKSFMGHRIKARAFDNSTRKVLAKRRQDPPAAADTRTLASALYAREQPTPGAGPSSGSTPHAHDHSLDFPMLQDALHALNARPPTPATFVATINVRHNALCSHSVSLCPTCSCGLVCCNCKSLFMPAVARHLACKQCRHIAHSCCQTAFCCECGKPWLPSDSVLPPTTSAAQRFRGGADTGTVSSPEPDIWTPSPRFSPDEIDDLTARAALPLPASRSESDASRAPSRASSVDEPVNVAATPLPTPDYSSLRDDVVDGLVHPSFPDRAILDTTDRRHFLGRGDLSVTSLKLYARRIFSDTSHWITAGHFLVDIFQGTTLNGSRDDFRRFVILVGTQLGFGDLFFFFF